jgi:uncharacterized membrane protein
VVRTRRLAPLAVHLAVLAAIGFYFIRFALLSVQVQDGYGAPGYDMGIFDQGVWLLAHFHAPFVTVNGRDLFGDHTSFVLLLAVPFYWVHDAPQTLCVLQAALIALAAVPIYALGRKLLGNDLLAGALAVAYLLNPALQHGNLEQFHPESFLVFFLALAVWAAVDWHPWVLGFSAAGCLMVKEDTALLIVPLGVWVLFRRNRWMGSALAAAAIAYGVFAYEVVIRFLLGDPGFYGNRIPFGGTLNLVGQPFTHPVTFWRYLISGYKPFYVWQMGVSYGWAFLVAPELAAVGALTLAENVLSDFPYMQQILYHYSLPLVPVLAMGTVYAVSRLRPPKVRAGATAYVLATAVVACYLWGLAPFSRHAVYPHSSPTDPSVLAVNQAISVIPPKAVVSADYMYVSHLDHRVACYQWPTPFRATYWHLYKQEGDYLPALAASVQYLVVPTDRSGTDAATFNLIAPQFELISSGGGASVYERLSPPPADFDPGPTP